MTSNGNISNTTSHKTTKCNQKNGERKQIFSPLISDVRRFGFIGDFLKFLATIAAKESRNAWNFQRAAGLAENHLALEADAFLLGQQRCLARSVEARHRLRLGSNGTLRRFFASLLLFWRLVTQWRILPFFAYMSHKD